MALTSAVLGATARVESEVLEIMGGIVPCSSIAEQAKTSAGGEAAPR